MGDHSSVVARQGLAPACAWLRRTLTENIQKEDELGGGEQEERTR